MEKIKKHLLLLLAIMLLSGCLPTAEENAGDQLMEIPVALINYENQFVSFSEKNSQFDLQPGFDSSCLFYLVSMNKDMLTKIKLSDDCFMADLSKGDAFTCNDFDQAGVFELVDLQGSFAAFKNKAMNHLAITKGGPTYDSVRSFKSIFYLLYDPVERHTAFNFDKTIGEFAKELRANQALREGLIKKSKDRGLPLEDIILLDAIWLYENNNAFNFADERKLVHYNSIKNNSDMMKLIAEKAEECEVSIPRMIWLDAKYIFAQEMKLNEATP